MHLDSVFKSRSFSRSPGGSEHFVSVIPSDRISLTDQIAAVEAGYAEAQQSLGLDAKSAIFRRLFVSDVMNQAASVHASSLTTDAQGGPVAVSIVQQQPLSGAKVALLAYHVDGPGPITKQRVSATSVLVRKNGLRHLWTTQLCTGTDKPATAVAAQTHQVFGDLVDVLASQGGLLRDHCVRTWIYLKGVDIFYQGMVDARRELFSQQGLTQETHYLASTGIEGACAHRCDLIAMDAYSILGLEPAQTAYLNDFAHLCSPSRYGVTFERGTEISYADRSHCFISGTASIDEVGRVVHPGDVVRQLDHALGNVEALLRSSSAALADLMHLTVYLRDPTDFARINHHLAGCFPELPIMVVQGAVCRPEWLVEVEGVAIAAHDRPSLPSF